MPKLKQPKVLLYDIETNGSNALYADLGFVMSFGYKWLGQKTTKVLSFDEYGGYKKHAYSDRDLLVRVLEIFEEADLTVGHYSDYFDWKFINGRLLINKLGPLPLVKRSDTLKICWKNFKFFSNRLKNVAKITKQREQKAENGWPHDWLAVLAGDRQALARINKYCAQDVRTLEGIYLDMRPFDQSHVRLFPKPVAGQTKKECKICGGATQYRGYMRTKDTQYRRLHCQSCGAWDKENLARIKKVG